MLQIDLNLNFVISRIQYLSDNIISQIPIPSQIYVDSDYKSVLSIIKIFFPEIDMNKYFNSFDIKNGIVETFKGYEKNIEFDRKISIQPCNKQIDKINNSAELLQIISIYRKHIINITLTNIWNMLNDIILYNIHNCVCDLNKVSKSNTSFTNNAYYSIFNYFFESIENSCFNFESFISYGNSSLFEYSTYNLEGDDEKIKKFIENNIKYIDKAKKYNFPVRYDDQYEKLSKRYYNNGISVEYY